MRYALLLGLGIALLTLASGCASSGGSSRAAPAGADSGPGTAKAAGDEAGSATVSFHVPTVT